MRLFSLVAFAAAFAAAPLNAQDAARVSGRVLDEAGAPVSHVRVELIDAGGVSRHASLSDQAGRFAMAGVAPGSYGVRAEALGYRGGEGRVQVSASERVVVELRLMRAALSLGEVVVSASRTSAPAATLPTTVQVVSGATLSEQASVSTGLNDALAKKVPGLAAATGSSSIFGQSFRGRNVAVLIDGVPQSTGRNVMRDFETLDVSAIERVEVLGGSTAIYGDGATGGVINIITRKPAPGLQLQTSLRVESAPADVGSGAGMRLVQNVSGQSGRVDYLVNGSWWTAGSFFDADGDRIPADPQGQGGLADYRSWSVLAKVGGSLGDARRLELSVNRFTGMQETEFTTDPAVNAAEPGTAKARAIAGLDLREHVGTENMNVVASVRDGDVLGGELRSQLFLRDYLTRFAPFDGRSYLNHVAQSFVDSRKVGGRIELERTLPGSLTGVWGVDYTREVSFQGLNVMDPDLFDESGGRTFRKIGETKWVPEIESGSLGLFAQLGWSPVERLSVRGGMRHERVRMHVDDFTTVTGNAVTGGDLDFSPVLLNVGAVVSATTALDLFASYAQGFSLADIGRVLRAAPAGFELGSKQLDAQLVDHYEAGVRGAWRRLQAAASVFYNESDLGTTFDAELNVIRAPERIRGLETSVVMQPLASLAVGGTFTWSEGESWNEAAQEWDSLNGFRIQPAKMTLHAEHRAARWINRLQLLHSGSRDRAFEDGLTYGHLPVESYTVVDWLGSVHAGPGRLELGVQNLLDAQYYPVVSQLYAQWGNSSRAAARGRTISIGYSVSY